MLNVTDLRRPAGRILAALATLVGLSLTACGGEASRSGPEAAVDFGVSRDFSAGTDAALEEFGATTGVTPRYVLSFRDWTPDYSTALIDRSELEPVYARGAEPMITWLPTVPEATLAGDSELREQFTPRAIADGSADAFIERAADEAADFGRPLWIRLAHEMNGGWTPWGPGAEGNTPRDYVAMWRHVVAIFRERGAENVRWAWTPNVVTDYNGVARFEPYFPGEEWVDAAGLDGYNFGSTEASSWHSFEEVFRSSYEALAELTDRPLFIAEAGSSEQGGDKAEWIASIAPALAEMPRIESLIWFDRLKEEDWRLDSSPASLQAFRDLTTGDVIAAEPASD